MADFSSPILKNASKSATKHYFIYRKDQILLKKYVITQKSKMAAQNQNGGKSAISYLIIDCNAIYRAHFELFLEAVN
jgi:hypothetical protein